MPSQYCTEENYIKIKYITNTRQQNTTDLGGVAEFMKYSWGYAKIRPVAFFLPEGMGSCIDRNRSFQVSVFLFLDLFSRWYLSDPVVI